MPLLLMLGAAPTQPDPAETTQPAGVQRAPPLHPPTVRPIVAACSPASYPQFFSAHYHSDDAFCEEDGICEDDGFY